MRFENQALNVPASAPNNGTACDVSRFIEKTVLVGGTFTGTLRIQGSLDGTNWADLTADVTTPQVVTLAHVVKYVRVRLTALSSGTPVVSHGGMDARAI